MLGRTKMKRRIVIAFLGTLLIAVAAGATVAVTAAADSEKAGEKGKVIRLVGCGEPPPAGQAEIDLPGPDRVGDLLVGSGDVCDPDGNKVGFFRSTCVWNFDDGVLCTNHTTLEGRGDIVTMQSGHPPSGPVVTEAVVGGTGEFRNSRGEARVDFSAGPPKVTIRLIG